MRSFFRAALAPDSLQFQSARLHAPPPQVTSPKTGSKAQASEYRPECPSEATVQQFIRREIEPHFQVKSTQRAFLAAVLASPRGLITRACSFLDSCSSIVCVCVLAGATDGLQNAGPEAQSRGFRWAKRQRRPSQVFAGIENISSPKKTYKCLVFLLLPFPPNS